MIRAFAEVSRVRELFCCECVLPHRRANSANLRFLLLIDPKEITMSVSTRRRFIEIVPFASLAFIAACSPKVEAPVAVLPTPATPEPTSPSPVVQSPAPAEPMPSTSASMPLVDENSPQAVALNYVNDAARANTSKVANHVAGSNCANCALYAGKPGDPEGMCPLFSGKHVAAKGWCSSWAKKA